MAFCVVKENIPARTCPNQCMNKVFIAVKYNVFIAVKFSISLAHVEKMAAHAGEEDDCVLCFSIFCKKITCFVQNRIIRISIQK